MYPHRKRITVIREIVLRRRNDRLNRTFLDMKISLYRDILELAQSNDLAA